MLLTLYGCVKDKPVVNDDPGVIISGGSRVFVINEGNYTSNNSSVSLYDASTNAVVADHYKATNNEPAGDVMQSMSRLNGDYALVVNNSGKVIICDRDLKKKAVISGLHSPRYITSVSFSKAYVTELYANRIDVVDLNSNTLRSVIPCRGWTEGITVIFHHAFATGYTSGYTYVVNTVTDHIEDSVYTGKGSESVCVDRNDKVWVLASGDLSSRSRPRISRINPLNNTVEFYHEFDLTDAPFRMCTNTTRDTLYFINGDIFRWPLAATVPERIVDAAGRKFFGLGISPHHRLYVSDAIDYVQRSDVYVYDMHGNKTALFKAGINTNGFSFE
jgi:hypothetical protein